VQIAARTHDDAAQAALKSRPTALVDGVLVLRISGHRPVAHQRCNALVGVPDVDAREALGEALQLILGAVVALRLLASGVPALRQRQEVPHEATFGAVAPNALTAQMNPVDHRPQRLQEPAQLLPGGGRVVPGGSSSSGSPRRARGCTWSCGAP